MKKAYNRIDPTRTWKQNYQVLAASHEKAIAYCELPKTIIYDADTSGLKFLCRTKGEYTTDFGEMWYQARNGRIISICWDSHFVSTFENMADVLKLYSSFGAAHNVAAYEQLKGLAK